MIKLLHEGAHGGARELVKARGMAWQLQGAEIDLGRQKAPQWSVKRGVSRSVWKAENAAANDSAFIPKWNPPVERRSVHRTQAPSLTRTMPDQEITRKIAAASDERYSFSCGMGGIRADIQGNCGREE